MRNPFRRRKKEKTHFVRLLFEHGPPALVGPMSRFGAEVFLHHEISQHPYHYKRRVISARIIGADE